MTDLSRLQPLVRQVVKGLARKFPSLDRDDISQTCWAWVAENQKRIDALLAEPGLLAGYIAQDVRRDLYKQGHGHDPKRIYTNSEMKAFLGRVLDPDWRARVVPDWEPVAQILEDAYGRLSDKDQEVLALHCREEMNFTAVGNVLGISRQAAERRVNRAMAHLQAEFERTDWEEEDGHWSDRYVGTRVSMSSAQSQSVISGQYDEDGMREPAPRLGGMRNIDE